MHPEQIECFHDIGGHIRAAIMSSLFRSALVWLTALALNFLTPGLGLFALGRRRVALICSFALFCLAIGFAIVRLVNTDQEDFIASIAFVIILTAFLIVGFLYLVPLVFIGAHIINKQNVSLAALSRRDLALVIVFLFFSWGGVVLNARLHYVMKDYWYLYRVPDNRAFPYSRRGDIVLISKGYFERVQIQSDDLFMVPRIGEGASSIARAKVATFVSIGATKGSLPVISDQDPLVGCASVHDASRQIKLLVRSYSTLANTYLYSYEPDSKWAHGSVDQIFNNMSHNRIILQYDNRTSHLAKNSAETIGRPLVKDKPIAVLIQTEPFQFKNKVSLNKSDPSPILLNAGLEKCDS